MSLPQKANALRKAETEGTSLREPAQHLAALACGPVVLAGWCLDARSHAHWLAASSGARKASADDKALWACFAALMLPPYPDHPVVLTNIILGLAEFESVWSTHAGYALSRLLAPFLLHAIGTGSLAVREQAIDALNDLPDRAFSQWTRTQMERVTAAGREASADARYPEVKEDLDKALLRLPRAGPDTPDMAWQAFWSDALRASLSELAESIGGGTAGRWARHALEPLQAFLAAAPLGPGIPSCRR